MGEISHLLGRASRIGPLTTLFRRHHEYCYMSPPKADVVDGLRLNVNKTGYMMYVNEPTTTQVNGNDRLSCTSAQRSKAMEA